MAPSNIEPNETEVPDFSDDLSDEALDRLGEGAKLCGSSSSHICTDPDRVSS